LGLFSLAQTRLPHYVLPLFPGSALLVAAAWPAVPSRLSRTLLGGTGVSVGVVLALAWIRSEQVARLLAPAYPAAAGATLPVSALVIAALVASAGGLALVRDGARLFNALAVVSALVLLISLQVALPAFSADFVAPAGELASTAARAARPCDTLVALGPYRPSLLFYARRPLVFVSRVGRQDDPGLAELGTRSGRLFVIAPATLARALPPTVGPLSVLDTRGGYVLLATDAPAHGCAA